MRKRLSKISALLMALVMVLSMSSNVFAASAGKDTTYGTSDDSAKITVTGIQDTSTTLEVYAYPIILAYYENDNFSDYINLYDEILMSDAKDDNGNITGFDVTEAELDAVRNIIAGSGNYDKYVQLSKDAAGNVIYSDGTTSYIVGDVAVDYYKLAVESYTTDSDGVTTCTYSYDGVAVGSYLIIVRNADSINYNEAVVSAFYTYAESTGNQVDEGTVNMIDDTHNTWIKASYPDAEKYVYNDYSNSYDTHNTANIGESVPFRIVVEPIPQYGGQYPVFEVTDTLSEGLVYDGTYGLTYVDTSIESLKVYVVDKSGVTHTLQSTETVADYRATIKLNDDGTTTITLQFVTGTANDGWGTYQLNAYEGGTLYIEYTATLTEDAEINENANTNTATVKYTTDSRSKGNDSSNDDETYTYTFDIDGAVTGSVTQKVITKTGEDETNGSYALEGAVFTLYTDKDCTTVYTNDSVVGQDEQGNDITFNGTVTSDSEGQLKIYGLEAGTYYLKETTAPTGYTLNTHVYEIQIIARYLSDGSGKLDYWTIVIDGETSSKFEVTYGSTVTVTSTIVGTNIPNTKTSGLPSTGGYGTMIFTMIGCAVMIISAAAYIKCRDKKAVR